MAKVSNLRIAAQSGTSNTIFATWDFASNTESPGSGQPQNGDLVRIKSGSTWYNGAAIPSWIYNNRWYIREITGSRAVVDKSENGSYSIMSPISIDRLEFTGSTTSSANASNLDHYQVRWSYNTGDGVWFDASESNTTSENVTYSYPNNAILVRVSVAPISKTYGDNNIPYWTPENNTAEYRVGDSAPNKMSAPSVTISDNFILKAIVNNISDSKVDQVEFEVYNGESRVAGGVSTVTTARAVYTTTVTSGGQYRVRCRAVNWVGGTRVYGDWSEFTGESETAPDGVQNLIFEVESESAVRLSWNGNSTATSYVVEASNDVRYFDSSSEVKSMTVTAQTAFVTGLTKGKKWYFRVKAKNSKGDSTWSNTVGTVVGSTPQPPTTWSLTTNASVGEDIILYWVHNTEDGSKMVGAEVELYINGVKTNKILTPDNSKSDREKIYSYKLDSSLYRTGGKILWRVRTTGVTREFSEWSIQRTITTYTPPTVELRIGDGNSPNMFVGAQDFSGDRWHPNKTGGYEDTQQTYKGYKVLRTKYRWQNLTQDIYVKKGRKYLFSAYVKTDGNNDEAYFYSAHYSGDYNDVTDKYTGTKVTLYREWTQFSIEFTALKDGVCTPRISKSTTNGYMYVCGMDCRLQPRDNVSSDGNIRTYPIPIGIVARPTTQKAMSCHLSVIAQDSYSIVNQNGDRVSVTSGNEVFSRLFSMPTNDLYYELTPNDLTLVRDKRYIITATISTDSGLTATTSQLTTVKWADTDYMPDASVKIDKDNLCAYITPYCFDRKGKMPKEVTLTVLRVGASGSLFVVGRDIPNDGTTSVTDPHPTLDFARYRVVSTDSMTGINEFSDIPAIPFQEPSIVLQWEESWKTLLPNTNRTPISEAWSGSMLKLPYNVDVNENYDLDSALTEYIGRSNPVSYYGTQKGVTATWSTDIPKYDKETIFQLRRLASWPGDVYVREPNGNGYYAQIKISMSIKHLAVVVPVTIEVKKVESGEI